MERKTVERLIAAGELKAFHVGRAIRVLTTEAERFESATSEDHATAS